MADEANEAPPEAAAPAPAPAATPAPPAATPEPTANANKKLEWIAALAVMIVFGAIISGFFWFVRR